MTGDRPTTGEGPTSGDRPARGARYTPEVIAGLLGLPAPTPQQSAIISADLKPMLIVAGAGSGKTETMTARVVYLVANELVRPEHILGLTFTRKAAGELTARIRRRLGQLAARLAGADDLLAGEPTIATYDAYAGRIHAEHGLRGGYEPGTRLISEAQRWRIADAAVRAHSGDMSYVDLFPSSVTAAVLALAGDLAGHLRTPAELADFHRDLPDIGGKAGRIQRARAQLVPIVEAYQTRLERAEEMAFGDQLHRAARIARDHPEVRQSERARYRVVLLDEYQDTSYGQFVLLRALFADGHPVTAVGDPAQAIYGWRGAAAGTLGRFKETFGAERAELSVSWRNQPGILAAANVLAAPLGDAAVLSSGRPEPGQPTVHCGFHLTSVDEAAWIAERIDRSLRAYWDDGHDPTAAVLVRKRSQMPALEAALKERGLPVEVIGLGGLLDTPEVTDVLSTLRVLVDPTAGGALLRLLTGPRWRLGPRDIVELYRHARRLGAADTVATLVEALDDIAGTTSDEDETGTEGEIGDFSVEGRRRLTAFAVELRGLRARLDRALPDLIADVIRTTRLDIEVIIRPAPDGQTHLAEFCDVAARFASDAKSPNLTTFLAYLDAAAQEERGLEPGPVPPTPGPSGTRGSPVQLTTVHGAKGLEWDVVAVAGLNDGQFPVAGKPSDTWLYGLGVLPFPLRGDAAGLPAFTGTAKEFEAAWRAHTAAEERRLAYVAVTRARDLLLCSGYHWSDTRLRPAEPGTFLTELREFCAGPDGVVDTWVAEPGGDNPLRARRSTISWPHDPLTPERRQALQEGAALVRSFLATPPVDLPEEVRLLLAERERALDGTGAVAMPARLTVSQLVTLGRDPGELARRLRRPLPERPGGHRARRGTAFHAWLEQRNGPQALLDLDELPGAADADGTEPDVDLAELCAAFEASEWALRAPHRVEVPFVTVVSGVVIRGRMDAVFLVEGGFEVIDWKTGEMPSGAAARAAAIQLAVYRLAWAELAGVPVDRVRAAFHYVRQDRTVRPVDLLDADGLAALVATHPPADAAFRPPADVAPHPLADQRGGDLAPAADPTVAH